MVDGGREKRAVSEEKTQKQRRGTEGGVRGGWDACLMDTVPGTDAACRLSHFTKMFFLILT